jgi:thiamine-phosphate pyrophosphorylase
MSAHSVEEMRRAAEAGADYATLSPIFPTASKPGYGPALGLAALEQASRFPISVVALGGVSPATAPACLRAGAAAIAVMGGVLAAQDPSAALRAYRSVLAGCAPRAARR